MPLFLDTRGHSSLGIGICARCSVKYSLDELIPDGNSPGLRVCRDGCWDPVDPWRLPPKSPDSITLQNPRPDIQLFPFTAIPVYIPGMLGVSSILPTVTWAASTTYPEGASVTPENVNDPAVNLPQYQFVAQTAGRSGSAPPVWATSAGVQVTDGTVVWICVGIALLDGITQQQPLGPNQ